MHTKQYLRNLQLNHEHSKTQSTCAAQKCHSQCDFIYIDVITQYSETKFRVFFDLMIRITITLTSINRTA